MSSKKVSNNKVEVKGRSRSGRPLSPSQLLRKRNKSRQRDEKDKLIRPFRSGSLRKIRKRAVMKLRNAQGSRYRGAGATAAFKRCISVLLSSLGFKVYNREINTQGKYVKSYEGGLVFSKNALMKLKIYTEEILKGYLAEVVKNTLFRKGITIQEKDVQRTFDTKCVNEKLDDYYEHLTSVKEDSESHKEAENKALNDYFNKRVIVDLVLEVSPGNIRISEESLNFIRDMAKRVLVKLLYPIGQIMEYTKKSVITESVLQASTHVRNSFGAMYDMPKYISNWSREKLTEDQKAKKQQKTESRKKEKEAKKAKKKAKENEA